ncbi:MAG: organomercurial lyase [bacterium]
MNFFTSDENLNTWLADHPDIQGEKMTVEEAFEVVKDLIKVEID